MPRRHRPSSPLLSLPVLIILLPIITLLILFYAIPPFLSLTSQILRPTISVKKSWDSLNVFLVIFAILCGIFAKRNDDGSPADEDHIQNVPDPLNNIAANNTSTSASQSESAESVVFTQQWFGFSDRTPETGGGGLRRSSSSYPDLRQLSRQDSLLETRDHVNKSQFRFFDDFEINGYHRTPPIPYHAASPHRQSKEYSDVIKEIPVDTFVLHSSPPPPKSPAPPPPPPPPVAPRQKPRRTHQTVGRKDHQKTEKVVHDNVINEAEELEKVRSQPPTPPPPPPQCPVAPPSPIRVRSEQKRRKSNVKKEIAMVWASVLSNQRKRKKKHKVTSTRNIYDTATHDDSSPEQPQHGGEGQYFYTRPPPSPPPPPPPPPPPYSVFHNLFKKGTSKTKKVHSVSTPPAPPPPPPQPTLRKHKSWSSSFPLAPPTPPQQPPPAASRPRASASSGRPPLPTSKANNYIYQENSNMNSGSQSPLIPVAPPPPPFKMPELKFFVRGDFVKIRSTQSSRCGSPELEDDDALPGKEEDSELERKVNVKDGGDGGVGGGTGGSSVFCPSPDVNTKADNFIARLRDEWKLEKMNSLREKKKMP